MFIFQSVSLGDVVVTLFCRHTLYNLKLSASKSF